MTDAETIVDELRRLLVGPDPRPDASPVELSARPLRLPARGPYVAADGEEILRWQRPSQRYGIGVLFPGGPMRPTDAGRAATDWELVQDRDDDSPEDDVDERPSPEETEHQEAVGALEGPGDGDEIVPHAAPSSLRPCTVGLSFLAKIGTHEELRVSVRGGRYLYAHLGPTDVTDDEGQRPDHAVRLWRRLPISLEGRIGGEELARSRHRTCPVPMEPPGPLHLEALLTSRPFGSGTFLITVTLVNRAHGANNDQNLLFQTELRCEVRRDGHPAPAIIPYPEQRSLKRAPEDASLALLYRSYPQFATGHGCAADWEAVTEERTCGVFTVPLPTYREQPITPTISGHNPTMLELSAEGWYGPLARLVSAYSQHVSCLDPRVLPEDHREAGQVHLHQARDAVRRMELGLRRLATDRDALRAFQWCNAAVRLQQLAGRQKRRTFVYWDSATQQPVFDTHRTSPVSVTVSAEDEPRWRAFQIAFILMNVASLAGGEDADHDIVDLVWFPTGGGKTEAYLGLAAFAMLYARLREPTAPPHVQVLMRYTMRLLTAQQFQRAAGLVCALECIRHENNDLGTVPFRLGVWVGAAMTPNTTDNALETADRMKRRQSADATLFLHSHCPWCAAEVGRTVDRGTERVLLGWKGDRGGTAFVCSDPGCWFHSAASLPFDIVDEQILRDPPSVIIATVDKFALLPKKPELRALFGIGDDGHRSAPPPMLIVQDELHLITDALGSMVGAYEPLVHALCEYEAATRPKVVCSTATIRTYADQVRRLFARDRVAVFPPPEFAMGDSFFAPFERSETGDIVRSKTYVGAFGSGFPSYQTAEARAIAALLQAPLAIDAAEDALARRDPYWTLLCFFNTIRELATTLTLSHTQIRAALRSITRWRNLERADGHVRPWLRLPLELTSRRKGAELARAFTDLERGLATGQAVDLCLATSIVEVGIDVSRLSLMCVVGQPKQCSTFIQATGRIGRRHPGVVVTLYDHTRPRDRSVFEHFRAVHERMHASVEPTSITPFAFPVQERAVAAVLAAAGRLLAPRAGLATSPTAVAPAALRHLELSLPRPTSQTPETAPLSWFLRYLVEWTGRAEPEGSTSMSRMLARRLREWREWQRKLWHCWSFQYDPNQHDPMMLDADPMAAEHERAIRWYVPNSMRDVDAESQLWVRPDIVPAIPGDNDELFPVGGTNQ